MNAFQEHRKEGCCINDELLKQLYHSYYREIYIYLYSMCRRHDLAEDLTQDTFLKAILSLSDNHGNMRAWLYIVARNLYFNFAKSVYTELFLPTKYRNEAIVEAEGYGEYNIVIPQISSTTGKHLSVSGKLTRGKFLMYDPNFFMQAPVNAFVINSDDYYIFSGTGAAGSSSEAFAALEELSDGTYYSAYFSLSALTEYEDFYKWYSSKELPCGELWCGVYTSNTSAEHLGFCPELSGRCIDWDRETYPRLCMLDDHSTVSQMENDQASSEVMQTHFTSMLRYMRDNKNTADLFCRNETDWDETIRYIDENGIDIFGFAIIADKETVMSFAEDPMISYVYTAVYQ